MSMSARPGYGNMHGAVNRATDSNAFEYAARAGFAASGVLHLLVGYIILQIALGSGGNADQSGALATLAGQTGGKVVLWVATVGLLALGLWRLAEAVIGSKPGEGSTGEDNPVWKRAKAVGLAIANFAIAFSAMQFATGSGQSSGQQNAGISAQLMQSGWGKLLLVLVGLGVIAVGGYHVYKGATKKFFKDLRVSGGTGITAVGVTGYVAKGLVLAGAGILVIVATLQADPAKASGLDAAVKTLGQAPFGKFLLIVAAVGIAAFGAYSFVRSRHGRM
ncbi:membrane protein [Mycolicibacterium litorale]|uniref:Membrane protein n=1 Tax=Mycolicibacterium litorale TaxID=758802 RepID=A0A6S6NYZ1_9MYCO|nr:membrane protein [Mycolicibacterium litorale]